MVVFRCMSTQSVGLDHSEPQPARTGTTRRSSPAALMTSVAALITALGGLYVAVREPTATKVSDASETISQATAVDHDQLVKLIQAVDDLSKNSDQNHDEIEALRTYLDTRLTAATRAAYASPGARPAPVTVTPTAVAPTAQPLKHITIPTVPPSPPRWSAKGEELVR